MVYVNVFKVFLFATQLKNVMKNVEMELIIICNVMMAIRMIMMAVPINVKSIPDLFAQMTDQDLCANKKSYF